MEKLVGVRRRAAELGRGSDGVALMNCPSRRRRDNEGRTRIFLVKLPEQLGGVDVRQAEHGGRSTVGIKGERESESQERKKESEYFIYIILGSLQYLNMN
ncbi:putative pollen-specific leucine-rich repeat extensin-like protein 3 [Iris pallida]|uniref:Pollen-specific leucine-rich repeat extensin-like protein 3 n=1 Tax=Iris pallida TaxID=29817 RepID=A0AAX6GCQ3_IRIPA|nr:putative pollen-specific leucine-rich repeat extensin-like protein 3 [Iris pallida]